VGDKVEAVRTVDEGLRAIADEEQGASASSGVAGALRAEVRAIAQARRRRTLAAALATAALLTVAVGVPAWRARHPPLAVADSVPRGSATSTEVATAFFPLTYSSLPVSNPQLVRLEVPRSALASFGLAPIDAPDAGSSGTVQADVLVGEDGVARAVRFVQQIAP
jgi:hypothetical protein